MSDRELSEISSDDLSDREIDTVAVPGDFEDEDDPINCQYV